MMNSSMRTTKSTKEGFTLVETIVSIFILNLAILLPLSASYIGISQAMQSRDQIIASYLAQDAMEYVRAKIVTNLQHDPSLSVLNGMNACGQVNGCSIDSVNDQVYSGNTSNPAILQDPVTGVYGHTTGWDPTPFMREVWVNQTNPNDPTFQILVRVEWGKEGARKELFLRENMSIWIECLHDPGPPSC
jgi:type II secretory pathway pseudopilin PulG